MPLPLPSYSWDQAATQLTRNGNTWGSGPINITYAFRTGSGGDTSTYGDLSKFSLSSATQIQAVEMALTAWSDVANISFTRVKDVGSEYSDQATMLFGNYTVSNQPSGAFANYPGLASFTDDAGDVWFNDDHNTKDRPIVNKAALATEGWTAIQNPTLGSGVYASIVIHEIGHALGLSHPADYNSAGTKQPTYENDAIYAEDSLQYTVMSYFAASKTGATYGVNPLTPMLHDIAAMQLLYGANMNTRADDDIYGWNGNTGREEFTITAITATDQMTVAIWDAGGIDTIDMSGYNDPQTIDLREEHFSSTGVQKNNIAIAKGVTIENATGGSNADKLFGNDADNYLIGNNGNDTLIGGDGSDRLEAGKGTDNKVFGDADASDTSLGDDDVAIFTNSRYHYSRADLTDGIRFTGSGVAAGEATNVHDSVEHVLFTGLTQGVVKGFQPVGTNKLLPNDDGTLDADGNSGNGITALDLSSTFLEGLNFYGTTYNGIYINNNGNVTFTQALSTYTPGQIGGGTLPIIAPFWGDVDTRSGGGSVFYNVDEVHGALTVTWSTVGYYSQHHDKINSFQLQLIDQGSGDFEIIFRYNNINWTTGDASGGTGGLGGSVAKAGFSAGTGTYGQYYELPQSGNQTGMLDLDNIVGNAGSAGAWQFRVSNGLIDGIGGELDDVLNGNQNVNFIDGGGGNDLIDGKGNNDVLIGGAGNDQINGGAGADKMTGGIGDDTYIVDNTKDSFTENKGEGTDTVQAAIDFALPMGTTKIEIENLILIGNAVKGTGNEFKNEIIGNDKNNTIDGGANDDTLDGGIGNDTLKGNNGNDTLLGGVGNDINDGGAGFDTVIYSNAVTIDLMAPSNNTGDASGDKFIAIERIAGSNSDDRLVGSNAIDDFFGRDGDDFINGNGGNDTIEGGAGNDTLFGGLGTDTLSYVHSNASVTVTLNGNFAANVSGGHAQGDIDVLSFENIYGANVGGAGDILTGDSNANELQGLDGNDQLFGMAGNDTIFGGFGDDIVNGGTITKIGNATIPDADKLDGGEGTNDTVSYETSTGSVAVVLGTNGIKSVGLGSDAAGDQIANFENIVGGAGADTLVGNNLTNKIEGRAGNDLIQGGAAADDLDGGTDTDTLSYTTSAAAVTVMLGAVPGDATFGVGGDANGDIIKNFENLLGGSGNDKLTGNAFVNLINGGGGDDLIEGGAGADTLSGGLAGDKGIDTLSYEHSVDPVSISLFTNSASLGDAQGDVISGFENVMGGTGNDIIFGDSKNNVIEGNAGADKLAGNGGFDWLAYSQSDAGVNVTLNLNLAATVSGGHANGDEDVLGFENVMGSKYDDVLVGDAQINLLIGGDGNDTLNGGIGKFADQLFGGGGDDTLIGGDGADTLDGFTGIDTASYAGEAGGVVIDLSSAKAGVVTGAGGFALGDKLTGIDNITGGNGGDTLTGDGASNILLGGGGNDILQGRGGADTLDGGAFIDTVSYAKSAGPVSLTLGSFGAESVGAFNDAQGDKITNVENVTGSDYGDILIGNEVVNVLNGGKGDDFIEGAGSSDTLIGGDGIDTLSYGNSSAPISISLLTNSASLNDALGDSISGFENVLGGASNDTIFGSNSDNVIEGGAGNDLLGGGLGKDTLAYTQSSAGVDVTLNGTGQAIVSGGDAQGDEAFNFENLIGSGYDDKLTGDTGVNIIKGGAGSDTITGGLGADILSGQGDADIFFYNSLAEKGDHITDFSSGFDQIQFKASGFQNTVAGGPIFSSSANPTPPSGTNACFLYDTSGVDAGKLFFDDDGTGAHVRQLVLTLDNIVPLQATDILIV